MALKSPHHNFAAYLGLMPAVRATPQGRLWLTHDTEGDVLYIHFCEPGRRATDSELTDDDLIVRYDGEEVIGLTILHASRR